MKENMPTQANPISSEDRWNRIRWGDGTPLPKVELPKGLFEDSQSFDYPELKKMASLAGKFLDEAHSEEDWSARLEAIVDRCAEHYDHEDLDQVLLKVLAEIMRQQKSNLPALVNPISSKDRWNRIMRGKGTPLPKVELPKGLFEDSRSFDYPELEKIASLAGKFLDEAHSEEDWSARLEAIVDRCGEYNEYEDFDPTMGRVLAEIMRQQKFKSDTPPIIRLENGITILAHSISENNNKITFKFKLDRPGELSDLSELWTPSSSNHLILDRLIKKGWFADNGTVLREVTQDKTKKHIQIKYWVPIK